ncbi:MAG: GGDEF domain-containing protein [Planctomycetota bacterium]|nr:GGDEF domain-containing protein [Planctomycetota bacterium]
MIPIVKTIEQALKKPEKLLAIREHDTIAQAAIMMNENQVGCLLVFDVNNKFTGVITERDIIAKVTSKSIPADNSRVCDIMTADTVSCDMDTNIAKVEQLMAEHKIRHVPIVENGVPVGMISSRDIIAYRLLSNERMKTAAEQLAMLPMGLKSLDSDDVINLAINQVPKSFGATRAVLYIARQNSAVPMVYRNACSAGKEHLDSIKISSANHRIVCEKICQQCENAGGQSPKLVIGLNVIEQSEHNGENHLNEQGYLCMCGFNTHSADSEELRVYKASLLRAVLSANLTNANLYQNYKKAFKDSETDPLTKLGTRRMLDRVLRAECERNARYRNPFSIAIIDLDNFKQINDTKGHGAGDMILQNLADIIRNGIRATDVAARYGGDEFVLLMPETTLDEAIVLLERLRRQAENISSNGMKTTISCGLTERTNSTDKSIEKLLKQADAALYQAKRGGRNRVVAHQCESTMS